MLIFLHHPSSKLIMTDFQLSSSLIMNTIPHLDTVAGDATFKSMTSKSILMEGVNFILSPFAKHSIMLSSKTVFMFSIHSASTGPSNTTQLLV